MDGSRRVQIGDSKIVRRKTKEKSNLIAQESAKKERGGMSAKKERGGILKNKVQIQVERSLQDITNSSQSEASGDLDSVGSDKTPETGQEETHVDTVEDEDDGGEGEREELSGSKASKSDAMSGSDLSEEEGLDREIVDSDYDTDLEMDGHSEF